MNETKPQWYIVGSKNQTRGPFTTAYIIKRCLSGKYGQNTLCWRDGMKDWQPLQQVQPFKVEIEKVKRRPGKIHFYCKCGNEIFAGKALAGKSIGKCNRCNQTLIVPLISQPATDIIELDQYHAADPSPPEA